MPNDKTYMKWLLSTIFVRFYELIFVCHMMRCIPISYSHLAYFMHISKYSDEERMTV